MCFFKCVCVCVCVCVHSTQIIYNKYLYSFINNGLLVFSKLFN